MNRRTRQRASVRTEIWLGENGIFTRSPEVLRDLSEGGAFVQTQQQFSKGSILSLCFDLPFTGYRISSTVIVRHCRDGAGIGVQFLDLSPEDRAELRDYVGDQVARVA
jgi:hypothetical protein